MAGTYLKTMRKWRLAEVTSPENEALVMQAVVEWITGDGEDEPGDFRMLCKKLDVPYTPFLMWIQEDAKRWEVFLKAHEARSIQYISEAVDISDGKKPVEGVEADAARDKLRVETRFRYARHHAPKLYGEGGESGKVQPVLNITIKNEDSEKKVVIDG